MRDEKDARRGKRTRKKVEMLLRLYRTSATFEKNRTALCCQAKGALEQTGMLMSSQRQPGDNLSCDMQGEHRSSAER